MYSYASGLAAAAVLLIGYGLKRLLPKVNSGFFPFISSACIMLFLLIGGSLRLLSCFTYSVYAAAAVCGVLLIVRIFKKRWEDIKEYWSSAGVIAFAVSCFVVLIIYRGNPPFYILWDDFSHWGLYYKNIYETGMFHFHSGLDVVHMAYPQGASVFYYFVSLFYPSFTEAGTHYALAVLYSACGAAMIAGARWKNRITAGLAVAALPLFFCLFPVTTPYITIYNDTLLGAFWGVCAIIAIAGRKNELQFSLALAVGLAALVQVKEMGILFALIVLALCFLSKLLYPSDGTFRSSVKANFGKGFLFQFSVCVLAAFVSMVLWKWVLNANIGETGSYFTKISFGDFFAKIGASMNGGDMYAAEVWSVFYNAVRTFPMSVFPASTTWTLLFLFGAASFFAGILLWRKTRQYGVAAALFAFPFAFLAYLFSLYYTYLCSMSQGEAMAAASFSRYSATFLVGWLMVLIYCVIRYLPRALPERAGRAIPACLLGTVIYLNTYAVTKNNALSLGSSPALSNIGPETSYSAQLRPHLNPDDRVWALFTDSESLSDLEHAHIYHYMLLPADADWRLGYANEVPAYITQEENPGYLTKSIVLDVIAERDIEYVLAVPLHGSIAPEFLSELGDFFEDKLESVRMAWTPVLYRVEYDYDGQVRFVPVARTE